MGKRIVVLLAFLLSLPAVSAAFFASETTGILTSIGFGLTMIFIFSYFFSKHESGHPGINSRDEYRALGGGTLAKLGVGAAGLGIGMGIGGTMAVGKGVKGLGRLGWGLTSRPRGWIWNQGGRLGKWGLGQAGRPLKWGWGKAGAGASAAWGGTYGAKAFGSRMVDWEKSPILNKIKSWREGRANLKDVEGEVETEMEDEEKIEAYSKSLQRYGEATLLKQTEIDNLSYEDEKLLGQMKSDLEKDLIKLRELKASFEKQLKEYQDNPAKKDLLYRLRVNKEWIESLERKVVDGLIPNMERKIKEMSSLNEQRKALESATYATLPNIFKAEAVSEQKAKEVFAAEGEVASLYDQSFSPSDTKTIINEEKKEEILDEKTKKLLEQEAKSEQEASEGENREQIKLVQQAQLLEGIKTNLESLSKANFNLPYAYISSDVDKMNRRLEQLFPKTGWFRFRGDNLKHVKEIHEKLLSLEKKGTKLSKKKDRLRDFAKNVLIDIKKKAKK